MKKTYLNKFKEVPFNKVFDINIGIRQGKFERVKFTDKELEDIKEGMLKKEYYTINNESEIEINTDKDRTIIRFYDNFILLHENINIHTMIGRRFNTSYIKYRK